MKNKTTATLLAFFLGGLGIHRFYLKQPILGILYLIFCWTYIPLIISLIDGIRLAIMNKDDFNQKYNPVKTGFQEECTYCNAGLTFMTTPNFGGGKLKDGKRVCRNCFQKIVKLDTRFGLQSKTIYDSDKVKNLLDNPKIISPRLKEKPSNITTKKESTPTIPSLVKSVHSVTDLKKLNKEGERYMKLFENSGYENKKYEKLNRIYEDAYYKACDIVIHYQFVPHIELNSPKEVLDFAFKVIDKKDYKSKRKQLGGGDYDWNEINVGELEDSKIADIIEKPPFYWESFLKFRAIIETNESYEEKALKITNLANSDKSFLDEFFNRDDSENAGEQWLKEEIRRFGVPLVDRLFDLEYNTPDKIANIDLEYIKTINGFGPQKIEQLKVAINKMNKK